MIAPGVHNEDTEEPLDRQIRVNLKTFLAQKSSVVELTQSAIFLLKTVPAARPAVLEYLEQVFETAVEKHQHEFAASNSGTGSQSNATTQLHAHISSTGSNSTTSGASDSSASSNATSSAQCGYAKSSSTIQLVSVVHQVQRALYSLVKANPSIWAPLVSPWSLQLLGYLSSKFADRPGQQPSSRSSGGPTAAHKLAEVMQRWMTCPPMRALIDLASHCVLNHNANSNQNYRRHTSTVGGTNHGVDPIIVGDTVSPASSSSAGDTDSCIDALLDTTIRYSPHFDWVVAHIGASFPHTVITRVLAVGLRHFVSQEPGVVESNKLISVVGILGHLADQHSAEIRRALADMFADGLSVTTGRPEIDTAHNTYSAMQVTSAGGISQSQCGKGQRHLKAQVDQHGGRRQKAVTEASKGGERGFPTAQQLAVVPYLLDLCAMSDLLLTSVVIDLPHTLTVSNLNRLHAHARLWLAQRMPIVQGGAAASQRMLVDLLLRCGRCEHEVLALLSLALRIRSRGRLDAASRASKSSQQQRQKVTGGQAEERLVETEDGNEGPHERLHAQVIVYVSGLLDRLLIELQRRVYAKVSVPLLASFDGSLAARDLLNQLDLLKPSKLPADSATIDNDHNSCYSWSISFVALVCLYCTSERQRLLVGLLAATDSAYGSSNNSAVTVTAFLRIIALIESTFPTVLADTLDALIVELRAGRVADPIVVLRNVGALAVLEPRARATLWRFADTLSLHSSECNLNYTAEIVRLLGRCGRLPADNIPESVLYKIICAAAVVFFAAARITPLYAYDTASNIQFDDPVNLLERAGVMAGGLTSLPAKSEAGVASVCGSHAKHVSEIEVQPSTAEISKRLANGQFKIQRPEHKQQKGRLPQTLRLKSVRDDGPALSFEADSVIKRRSISGSISESQDSHCSFQNINKIALREELTSKQQNLPAVVQAATHARKVDWMAASLRLFEVTCENSLARKMALRLLLDGVADPGTSELFGAVPREAARRVLPQRSSIQRFTVASIFAPSSGATTSLLDENRSIVASINFPQSHSSIMRAGVVGDGLRAGRCGFEPPLDARRTRANQHCFLRALRICCGSLTSRHSLSVPNGLAVVSGSGTVARNRDLEPERSRNVSGGTRQASGSDSKSANSKLTTLEAASYLTPLRPLSSSLSTSAPSNGRVCGGAGDGEADDGWCSVATILVDIVSPDVLFQQPPLWPATDDVMLKASHERDVEIRETFRANPILWDVLALVAAEQPVALCRHAASIVRSLLACQMTFWKNSQDFLPPLVHPLHPGDQHKQLLITGQQANGGGDWQTYDCEQRAITIRVLRLMAASGMLPSPLADVPLIVDRLNAFDLYCILVDIWNYVRDTYESNLTRNLAGPVTALTVSEGITPGSASNAVGTGSAPQTASTGVGEEHQTIGSNSEDARLARYTHNLRIILLNRIDRVGSLYAKLFPVN